MGGGGGGVGQLAYEKGPLVQKRTNFEVLERPSGGLSEHSTSTVRKRFLYSNEHSMGPFTLLCDPTAQAHI